MRETAEERGVSRHRPRVAARTALEARGEAAMMALAAAMSDGLVGAPKAMTISPEEERCQTMYAVKTRSSKWPGNAFAASISLEWGARVISCRSRPFSYMSWSITRS